MALELELFPAFCVCAREQKKHAGIAIRVFCSSRPQPVLDPCAYEANNEMHQKAVEHNTGKNISRVHRGYFIVLEPFFVPSSLIPPVQF